MCNVLVFSKDRACQLDALLRSLRVNGPGYGVVDVLVKASTAEHLRAYRILAKQTRRMRFHVETDFHAQTNRWLERAGPVLSFLVDDQVFYRPAWPALEPGVVYQLGSNTTACHPAGGESKPSAPVGFVPGAFWFTWRDSTGDFGYPLSIGGNVYAKTELEPVWPKFFDSPTSLEAELACLAPYFPRDILVSPLHSCLVSLPLNRVTTQSSNPIYGGEEWTAERLCGLYLDGWRLDWEAMDWSLVDAAHAEVPPKFVRG